MKAILVLSLWLLAFIVGAETSFQFLTSTNGNVLCTNAMFYRTSGSKVVFSVDGSFESFPYSQLSPAVFTALKLDAVKLDLDQIQLEQKANVSAQFVAAQQAKQAAIAQAKLNAKREAQRQLAERRAAMAVTAQKEQEERPQTIIVVAPQQRRASPWERMGLVP